MRGYFDASALLPSLVTEVGTPAVEACLAGLTERPVVSEFAAAEVAAALSRAVRTSRLPAWDAQERLVDFDTWRTTAAEAVEITDSDVRLAHVFVRRFDLMLRTPDALHAALCHRSGLELITLDRRLAAAASALNISVRLLQG